MSSLNNTLKIAVLPGDGIGRHDFPADPVAGKDRDLEGVVQR